jgi:hypothetical protein
LLKPEASSVFADADPAGNDVGCTGPDDCGEAALVDPVVSVPAGFSGFELPIWEIFVPPEDVPCDAVDETCWPPVIRTCWTQTSTRIMETPERSSRR